MAALRADRSGLPPARQDRRPRSHATPRSAARRSQASIDRSARLLRSCFGSAEAGRLRWPPPPSFFATSLTSKSGRERNDQRRSPSASSKYAPTNGASGNFCSIASPTSDQWAVAFTIGTRYPPISPHRANPTIVSHRLIAEAEDRLALARQVVHVQRLPDLEIHRVRAERGRHLAAVRQLEPPEVAILDVAGSAAAAPCPGACSSSPSSRRSGPCRRWRTSRSPSSSCADLW